MSVLKPSQSQKSILEARVYQIMNVIFPDFKCSLTDIRFPKKDFVIQFYTFILEQLRVSIPKVMQKPLESQLQGQKYPELYTEVLQLTNLSQVLRVLFVKVQCTIKFGLNDLLDPHPTRTSSFMFAILNFHTFCDGRVAELIDKLEVISERKKELEKLLDARERLSREINQRAIRKGKRIDNAKEMKIKRAEMDQLKKEGQSQDHLVEKKRSELEDVNRHIARIKDEIAEERKTYQKLEAQQVQSPDALKNNLKLLEEKLRESKEQLHQIQDKKKDKKKTIKLFESVGKMLENRLALLTEIVKENTSVKKSENLHAELLSKIKHEQDETEVSVNRLKELKNEWSQLTAQRTTLELQWKKNKSSLQESIRHLSQEGKALEENQSSELENVQQAIEKCQLDVNEIIEENANLNAHYEKLYAALMNKEESFVKDKEAFIDNIIADLEKAKKKNARERFKSCITVVVICTSKS